MKSRFVIDIEYGALRFFCALVNAVPYAVAMSLAKGLAVLAFDGFRFKRGRTLGRIRSVFPGIAPREARRIARESLANLLETAVEMIRAPRLDRAWMDRHVVEGERYRKVLGELVDEGRGVVIMVPHCGNWYMAAWAMARYGQPLFAIAARQRNPKIDAWMNRQYGDVEVLDRDRSDTLRKIRDYLSAGRAFAILPDLRVRKPDVEADFLGGKANVSRAGASFAVRAGCPVLVAAMRREKGRHVFEHLATLRPLENSRAEAERLTREALALHSGFIRRHPGSWYWYNKRWILEPVVSRQVF